MSLKIGELETNLIMADVTLQTKDEEIKELHKQIQKRDEKIESLMKQQK